MISNPFPPQTAPLGTCSAGPVSWTTFCSSLVQKSSRNGPQTEPREHPRRARKGTRIETPKWPKGLPKWTPKWPPKRSIADPRRHPETPEDPPTPYEARPWGACWPKPRRRAGVELPGDRFRSSRARSHPFLVLRGLFWTGKLVKI